MQLLWFSHTVSVIFEAFDENTGTTISLDRAQSQAQQTCKKKHWKENTREKELEEGHIRERGEEMNDLKEY